jgi:hypothetical protein
MIFRSSVALSAGGVQLIIFIIVWENPMDHIRRLGNIRLRQLGEIPTVRERRGWGERELIVEYIPTQHVNETI